MSRERTYDPREGEFVDFATMDDWRARDEAQAARISQLEAQVEGLLAEIGAVYQVCVDPKEADDKAVRGWIEVQTRAALNSEGKE